MKPPEMSANKGGYTAQTSTAKRNSMHKEKFNKLNNWLAKAEQVDPITLQTNGYYLYTYSA